MTNKIYFFYIKIFIFLFSQGEGGTFEWPDIEGEGIKEKDSGLEKSMSKERKQKDVKLQEQWDRTDLPEWFR